MGIWWIFTNILYNEFLLLSAAGFDRCKLEGWLFIYLADTKI